MRYEMKMPDLSTNEPEIRVIGWLVQTGQDVRRGDSLLEVETDKATMQVESPVDGRVIELIASADQRVAVGAVIAILEIEP